MAANLTHTRRRPIPASNTDRSYNTSVIASTPLLKIGHRRVRVRELPEAGYLNLMVNSVAIITQRISNPVGRRGRGSTLSQTLSLRRCKVSDHYELSYAIDI